MTTDKIAIDEDTLDDAVEVFGEEAQYHKAGEECSELSAEISRYMNGLSTDADLISELADVIVMIRQLERMVDSDILSRSVAYKMDRLRDKINEQQMNMSDKE